MIHHIRNHLEECECSRCGEPLYVGDRAHYNREEEPFCSAKCIRDAETAVSLEARAETIEALDLAPGSFGNTVAAHFRTRVREGNLS